MRGVGQDTLLSVSPAPEQRGRVSVWEMMTAGTNSKQFTPPPRSGMAAHHLSKMINISQNSQRHSWEGEAKSRVFFIFQEQWETHMGSVLRQRWGGGGVAYL